MPHARPAHARHLDQRGPLVFDTRALGPGSARTQERTAAAPADLGAGLVGVAPGSELQVTAQLEGVSEGVLVTATAVAPLTGECARCLEPFAATTTVTFQELFSYDADEAGPDGYALDGDLLDLEPALRDALVLELPLSPLCAEDCAGLCQQCGVRLADAEPGHAHGDDEGGIWAALRGLTFGDDAAPGNANPDRGTDPDTQKEQ